MLKILYDHEVKAKMVFVSEENVPAFRISPYVSNSPSGTHFR